MILLFSLLCFLLFLFLFLLRFLFNVFTHLPVFMFQLNFQLLAILLHFLEYLITLKTIWQFDGTICSFSINSIRFICRQRLLGHIYFWLFLNINRWWLYIGYLDATHNGHSCHSMRCHYYIFKTKIKFIIIQNPNYILLFFQNKL